MSILVFYDPLTYLIYLIAKLHGHEVLLARSRCFRVLPLRGLAQTKKKVPGVVEALWWLENGRNAMVKNHWWKEEMGGK